MTAPEQVLGVSVYAAMIPPIPLLYVFAKTPGFACVVERDPTNQRLIIGMSLGLFREIERHILEHEGPTNKPNMRAEIIFTESPVVPIPMAVPPSLHPEFVALFASYPPALLLMPRPITQPVRD
jgi:hypothetical protein